MAIPKVCSNAGAQAQTLPVGPHPVGPTLLLSACRHWVLLVVQHKKPTALRVWCTAKGVPSTSCPEGRLGSWSSHSGSQLLLLVYHDGVPGTSCPDGQLGSGSAQSGSQQLFSPKQFTGTPHGWKAPPRPGHPGRGANLRRFGGDLEATHKAVVHRAWTYAMGRCGVQPVPLRRDTGNMLTRLAHSHTTRQSAELKGDDPADGAAPGKGAVALPIPC